MRTPVPHRNSPQRASTKTTEDLVLVGAARRVLQDICLHCGLGVLDLHLLDFEFGYLVRRQTSTAR